MSAGTLEIVKSEIGRLLGLDGHTDPNETNGQYAPFLTGDGLRGLRLYPMNKAFKIGNDYRILPPRFYATVYDDFIGKSLDNVWGTNVGSDGSAAAAINPALNGTMRLTSGAGATHTPAVNGSQIVGAKNFQMNSGGTRFEAYLGKISALTSQAINFGLTDSVAQAATFAVATGTVTTASTNAVGFVQDAGGGTGHTHLFCAAVNAGGTVQQVELTNDVDTAAFHAYRIDIDNLGNATFYIDGVKVASISLAVAVTAALAPQVAMYAEATTASQTLDIDYLMVEGLANRG